MGKYGRYHIVQSTNNINDNKIYILERTWKHIKFIYGALKIKLGIEN